MLEGKPSFVQKWGSHNARVDIKRPGRGSERKERSTSKCQSRWWDEPEPCSISGNPCSSCCELPKMTNTFRLVKVDRFTAARSLTLRRQMVEEENLWRRRTTPPPRGTGKKHTDKPKHFTRSQLLYNIAILCSDTNKECYAFWMNRTTIANGQRNNAGTTPLNRSK